MSKNDYQMKKHDKWKANFNDKIYKFWMEEHMLLWNSFIQVNNGSPYEMYIFDKRVTSISF